MSRDEIAPAIEKHEAQSLERLYPIKFFDALIFQGANENIVGQFSYARALITDAIEKKEIAKAKTEGVSYKGPNAFKLLQMQKFGANSFSPECLHNWKTFTDGIMEAGKAKPEVINDCIHLMEQVAAMKLSPIWLNVVFNNEWKKTGAPDRAIKTFNALKAVQQKNQATLNWINEKTQDLNITKEQIKEWGKPDFVKKNIPKLRDQFLNKLGFRKNAGPESLKAKYDAADNFGRLALMQYVRSAVTIYDETIKAMKGSDQYTDEKQHARDFAEMLQGYFDMMEASMLLIPKYDESQMMMPGGGYENKALTFNQYIESLHNGRSYKFGFGNASQTSDGFDKLFLDAKGGALANQALQFEARPEFAVDSFVIGSKADLHFSTHWPTRLEEYFTVFHQNMEKVAKFLNTKNGLDENILSGNVQQIAAQIKGKFSQDISSLVSEGSNLEVNYQIPLRQHSSALTLRSIPKLLKRGSISR